MSTGQIACRERMVRKRHLCTYCLAPILPGAVADWWSWSDCGRATTYYAHPRCAEMHIEVNQWGDDDEVMDPGEFRDACIETLLGESFPWVEASE